MPTVKLTTEDRCIRCLAGDVTHVLHSMAALGSSDDDELRERERLANILRDRFPEGWAVPVMVTHRSKSYLSASVEVFGILPGNDLEPAEVATYGWAVAKVTGRKFDRTYGGVMVRGGNTSLTYEIVSDLGRALYGSSNALRMREL